MMFAGTLHPEFHTAAYFNDLGLSFNVATSKRPFLSTQPKVIIVFALFHMYFVHGFYHLIISYLFAVCLLIPRMKAPRNQGPDLLIYISYTYKGTWNIVAST